MSIWKRLSDLARASTTPLEPYDDLREELDPLRDAARSESNFSAEALGWYRDLGLAPGADRAQIRQAYRRELLSFHPDRFANDPGKLETATEITRRLTEAYDGLMQVHAKE